MCKSDSPARAAWFRSDEKPITLVFVRRVATLLATGVLLVGRASRADTPTPPTPTVPQAADVTNATGTAGSDAPIVDTSPASQNAGGGASFFPEAPPEAPPPLPRRKGLVLETRLGGMAFLGKFSSVAPPAPWLQSQLGWEFTKWLMLYGYGEVAFTGTSNNTTESTTYYFPIYGFGGGLRFTIPVTSRVAIFVQGNAGAMSAVIESGGLPKGGLALLGFENAESLGFAAGGRVGVEWYQIDRHMALTLGVGLRDAFNFKIETGENDLPLMLDAGVALRYTF